jgi:hypothetical protein
MLNFKIVIAFSIVILTGSCNSNDDKDLQYEFLLTCYEDYYLNYGLEITPILDDFEQELIAEGHLKDGTGKSYKVLLNYLKENNYFKTPLKKIDFENEILYKSPKNIANCGISVFGLDSTNIAQTSYFRAERKIGEALNNSEDISVNFIFDVYSKELSNEDLEKPFVRQSMLVFFYRWYFQSKYDRNIPIDLNKASEGQASGS